MDNGFNTSGAPFEYTVAERNGTKLLFKRLTLIALYVLWVAVWLLIGAAARVIVPLLALVPISLWILIFLTWRLTQVEYEYSFFAGVLTVSRVLGGRTRRELCRVTIRNAVSVLPCEEEFTSQIEKFDAERTVFAASDQNAPDLYAMLWCDEDGTRSLLLFEPNEKALKILRYYNMSSVTLKK